MWIVERKNICNKYEIFGAKEEREQLSDNGDVSHSLITRFLIFVNGQWDWVNSEDYVPLKTVVYALGEFVE
jgi:hypothetical protein